MVTTASSIDTIVDPFPRRQWTLALFGTLIGVICALNLMPADSQPAGNMATSATCLSLGILIEPIAAFLRRPRTILDSTTILPFGIFYWLLLDLIQGSYPLNGVFPVNIEMAFKTIAAFNGIFVLVVGVSPIPLSRTLANSAAKEHSSQSLLVIAQICFILAFLRYAIPCSFNFPLMLSSLLADRFSAPWSRGESGGWDAFLDHFAYFGYLLPSLAVLYGRRKGFLRFATLLLTLEAFFISMFLMQSGSRRIIGFVVGLAILVWFLDSPSFRFRHILYLIGSLSIVLFVFELMLVGRSGGLGSLLSSGEIERSEAVQIQKLHIDDNFLRLTQVISLYPSSLPYAGIDYIVWALVRPIPRVLWPGKPMTPGFDLPAAIGAQGVSLTCTVLGEAYASFGFAGVAGAALLFGLLSGQLRMMLNLEHTTGLILNYGTLLLALFVGLRSIIELILMSYVFLAFVAVGRLSRFFHRDPTLP